ncbi:carboxypeptidase-like regulatory domain-containing protein [Aliifodinibius sp. S!AR15-10]|uniref:carboxypeptidase-like regulatory domain-containing protein n=1 Tax=Aliifodinibius sp. S!AR15-10 TaxID=2950437 RepID=UPI00285F8ECA|nr:carboxypeptidase-like regulatory domain-containing protein [Aliifodinibius sp. S!AR15-10]MDR8393715.1 carboxypeptidase-like regulatory domain-containing protein [Aliifodinibius sp. S!AR15-10]
MPILTFLFVTSCGDTPVDGDTDASTSIVDSTDVNNDITFVPEQFNAVGSIQGTVIDKATGESLSDVAVSLLFNPEDAEETSVITDTTGANGTFAFQGVPVNEDADDDSGNSAYSLEINTEGMDNYRDLFRFMAPLKFESTAGDGAANNLVANVTVPLSERAASVKGKLHTWGGTVLSDVKVYLYQWFNPVINGGGSTQTEMLVDSTTTGSDGSFMFKNVEEGARIWFEAVDESDPSEVINYTSGFENTKSASGDASATIDYGVVQVGTQDESGAFYVEEVTPASESDVTTDTMFTYTFNRPVADNEYTRTDLGFGNDTFKDDIRFWDNGSKGKSPGDVEFSVAWSSDRTALTITPTGLEDAHEYRLDVNNAFNNQDFVDQHGNNLTYNGNTTYSNDNEVEFLSFTTNDNNAKPHTPQLAINSEDVANLDFNGGNVELSWDVDESATDVKEYELWKKEGEGSYEHVTTYSRDDAAFNELSKDVYTGDFVIYRGEFNNVPDEAVSMKYKVRAISENLREGDFSNEVTVSDNTLPDITGASYNTATGDNTGEVTVQYAEPMMKSQVENSANYTFYDSGDNEISVNILSIEYDGSNGQTVITIEDQTSLTSGTSEYVEVTGVTDLSGNGMDTADSNSDSSDDDDNDPDSNGNEATY